MRVVRYTYAAAHELFPRRTEQYTDLRIEAVRKVLEQDKFAERSELERELRDPNACVAVAWVEHDAVAACVFRMPPPKKERERAARVMKIIALRVTQGNQNKGFGTAIVKALQHAAAVHGCTKIWVKAAASATSWWQRDKLGFAPCAEAQAAATLWPTDLTLVPLSADVVPTDLSFQAAREAALAVEEKFEVSTGRRDPGTALPAHNEWHKDASLCPKDGTMIAVEDRDVREKDQKGQVSYKKGWYFLAAVELTAVVGSSGHGGPTWT